MTQSLISVAEAKSLIGAHVWRLPSTRMLLGDALGLVLAEDVIAPLNMPGFNQSAMDGYAFSWKGFLQYGALTIVGEVAAGAAEAGPRPAPNQAVRIFTGAPVPDGFDTVVMQEKVSVSQGLLHILDEGLVQGRNVRLVGSEIEEGALAMQSGTPLTPPAIGFLASLGITQVSVIPAPTIALVVTGDELQTPGVALTFGQVYESNSQLLQAALQWLRFSQVKIHYAKDDLDSLTRTLSAAVEVSDLVLLTGGVSVGDYDFVPKAAAAAGVEAVFHKIKQKPGKPLFFGMKKGATFSAGGAHAQSEIGSANQTVVFGLPGNPASVLTCFYQYVTVALEKLSGRSVTMKPCRAQLQSDYQKPAGLTHFLKADLHAAADEHS
ncbi:MAG: molybdopterin molybdotransferase MoeA, partial [Sphingomonadales bacterium]|nr:molybdopterin molybdotransferase MoeA [Sphingomonadales bacterium]